jgi:hypothetical protein
MKELYDFQEVIVDKLIEEGISEDGILEFLNKFNTIGSQYILESAYLSNEIRKRKLNKLVNKLNNK